MKCICIILRKGLVSQRYCVFYGVLHVVGVPQVFSDSTHSKVDIVVVTTATITTVAFLGAAHLTYYFTFYSLLGELHTFIFTAGLF